MTFFQQKRRDPRFDKLSGQLNQDLFEKSYNFLNDYKKSEMEMLKERIKKEQDPDEQDRMKGLLLKMVTHTHFNHFFQTCSLLLIFFCYSGFC